MTRRKATTDDKPKARKKTRRKSWLSQFFHIAISTPVRQLILIVIIVVLLAVFRDRIETAIGNILELFGWGLVFIIAAIITLIVMIWRRKLTSFIFHWNRWLGSIVFILAVWGILALLRLGGDFGRDIIAFPSSNWVSVPRILALIIIGIFLVVPRACFRGLGKFFAWVGKQFERQPAPGRMVSQEPQPPVRRVIHPKPPLEEKPPLPTEMSQPILPPEVATSKAALEAAALRCVLRRFQQ